jgi:formylglycine-generating enzyme required for sulfatase activity/LysM repeat protein
LKLEQKLLLSEPAKSEEPEPAPAVEKYHIVKSGDFLAKIAKQYKLNYNDLARWNNIPYPYALKLEQKLLLSEPAKTEEPKPTVVVSDNDKDGIPDDKDFCPNTTSENIIKGVDNMGCVIQLPVKTEEPEPTVVVSDNDKDGIPDDKDFCPNTTTDEIIKGIDDMGCVIQVEEKQEVEAKPLVSEAAKTETPAEEKIPAVEKYHIVKSGDFLAKIAKQYKVNYKDLARWNNIPYPYALKLGQKLLVSEPPKSEEPEPAPAVEKYHIVKSGDFLAKIAKQYGINYYDLARWNNIPPPYALKLGQKLLVSEPPKIEEPESEPTQIIDNDKDGVPDDKDSCLNTTTDEIIKGVDNMGCVVKQEQTSEKAAYHIVKSGDFLAKIAKRYGISYKKIARWNNLPRPYALKLGQKLLLSEPMDKDQDDVPDDKDHCPNTTIEEIGKGVDAMGCPSAAIIPSNEPLYHLVKRGESLFKISRLYKISYKDLASWNKISVSDSLKLGQKLLVSKPKQSFLDEGNLDTDGDGIDDDKDNCPNNTDEEVTIGVDEQGCAIKIDDDFDFSFPSENKKKLSKLVAEAPVFNRKKNLFFHDRLRDGSLGPEMAWIPAGSFKMGDLQGSGDIDEQPVHEVSIKRFASSRYEITFSDYDKFATATRRKKPNDENWGRGIRPVINVNWEDARAYTNWLSHQTGHKYRLPTEAEWEYAARAGTKTKYWWGNNIGSNNATCNKCNSQWGWDAQHMTAPVGSFKPNPFGLYDTVGNVYEWTCSGYGIESKTKKTKYIQYNGKEQVCADRKTKNKFRVIRGGHWLSDPEDSRAAHRFESWLGYRVNFIGFRVVRE